MDFSRPRVMGIINVTPDSFYSGSRVSDREALCRRVREMRRSGVDILDIGGYSTRPGCAEISEREEYDRLAYALEEVRREWEECVISVDTFRSRVARRCVEGWNVEIINDIGGGSLDEDMFATVAELKVAYVLMHMRGTPQTMGRFAEYSDVAAEVLSEMAFSLAELRRLGVCDIIIDPGFGFAKSVEQNFQLLSHLELFQTFGLPVLAGMSRKRMVWESLGGSPEDSLNGTTALNMVALMKGADILRVHDVAAAGECVRLFTRLS